MSAAEVHNELVDGAHTPMDKPGPAGTGAAARGYRGVSLGRQKSAVGVQLFDKYFESAFGVFTSGTAEDMTD